MTAICYNVIILINEVINLDNCKKDMTGQRFGIVTITGRASDHIQPSGRRRIMWNCRCDCGKEFVCRDDAVKTLESCGCKRNRDNAIRLTKHSNSRTRLYRVYHSMMGRCCNPRDSSYGRYGGRGISVCEEWRSDNTNFFRWAKENGYDEANHELSLERIDVDGDYCPENCKWIPIKDQYNNRRSSIRIADLSLAQFCKQAGLNYAHVRGLYYRTKDIVYALGFTDKPSRHAQTQD